MPIHVINDAQSMMSSNSSEVGLTPGMTSGSSKERRGALNNLETYLCIMMYRGTPVWI